MIGSKNVSGFSLIEMLVVVALFSSAAVVLSQIFVSYNQLHRKVAHAAVLAQDMRFAMESIVRSIRTTPLDYESVPKGFVPRDNRLLLRKVTGGSIGISMAAGTTPACADTTVSNCLVVTTDGTTFQPITAKRVNVKRFDVYARPAKNPFQPLSGGGYDNDRQPFVTINLDLEYIADNPKDTVRLQAQTTVAARMYLR